MNLFQIAQMPKGTFNVNDKYAVAIRGGSGMEGFFDMLTGEKPREPAENTVVIAAAYTMDHAGFFWQFPGKDIVRWRVLSFKHYHAKRGKWWTEKPGKTHLFVLRLEDIELVMPPENEGSWYSYPRVRIGGEEIGLSVTGGGPGDDGRWTDFFSSTNDTCCNLPLKQLKAIARTAIEISQKAGTCLKSDAGDEHRDWVYLRRLVAEKIGPKALKPGDQFELDGCHFNDQTTHGVVGNIFAKRRLCKTVGDPWPIRVKFSQIDWVKTCELNGYTFPVDFPEEPKVEEKVAQEA